MEREATSGLRCQHRMPHIMLCSPLRLLLYRYPFATQSSILIHPSYEKELYVHTITLRSSCSFTAH